MPTRTVTLAKLHENQRKIAQDKARFRVMSCGRRFGKTEYAVWELAHRAIEGKRCAYFAPSYKMTTEVWRMLLHRLSPLITKSNKNEGRIDLETKGLIEVWSLSTTSAESVRGRKYHFIVVDEAAMVVAGLDVWNKVLQPLLLDYKGSALFCSTPRGRNWFYELYQLGIDPEFPDYSAWHFPTIANPHIAPDEIERARKSTPERSFRQEYLAEFVDDVGSVFRDVFAVCIAEPREPEEGGHYVFGIDWGRDIDFTVISVIDVNTMTQVYLDRFNQVSWEIQRGRVRALAELYQPRMILAERNSIGDPLIEALNDEGLEVVGFATTQQSKKYIVEQLSLAMEQRAITLLKDVVQKHELSAYAMERTPAGNITYSAPQGGHDDTVIALCLAYHATSISDYSPVMRTARVKW